MKRLFLGTSLLFFITPQGRCQDNDYLSTLDSNAKDKESYYSEYNENDFEKFFNLLSESVITYYDLNETYRTQLQMANFKKTLEYKRLKNELILKEKQLMTKRFIYRKSLSNLSDYNLKTKEFSFNYDINFGHMGNEYIQSDKHLIARPLSIKSVFHKNPYSSSYSDYVTYSFKIQDTKLAEYIEENKESLQFVYYIKYKNYGIMKNIYDYGTLLRKFLVADLIKIDIYDTNKEEVIYTIKYKPLTTKTKRK